MKKFFSIKKIITIAVILLIAIGVTIKVRSDGNKAQTFDIKTESTVSPTRQNIKEEITLTGSIDATSKANLQFQTSGQLAWVGVKVGDKVKKYQAIASLNKEILKKQLQSDFNNYKTAASNFYDKADEYKDSVLTTEVRRILERNQNTLDNSVINYELQDLAIKYSTLISPITGVVVDIEQPNSGVNVTPSSASFVIIDPNSIYFRSKIDQEDVPKIKVGDKTTIKLDSFPEKTFESEIEYIAFTPITGESNTIYELRFKFPKENDNLQYRLGMDGDAVISLKEVENALTVPVESLHQENGQIYVFVKENDNTNMSKKYIKTGIETDTFVEILEGLSENDQIVITK
ncbi:MAG: efflux RND transporter periplasmic adaptor subunit [Candidatus Shapirobacteria bacterium]|nr:efflux RND transporter periplasmic adaptor subunit [Candidatus Shapirobacteria bacterium]MDD3002300.1 efflux RND transporter periplasmic adaptor subunit [Candidatus Shapirobacteria bacterium]MDD4382695.1 efflux RND transporter periplasmic adaptor subunit [Candidatus Shapirobacteria bacterium]